MNDHGTVYSCKHKLDAKKLMRKQQKLHKQRKNVTISEKQQKRGQRNEKEQKDSLKQYDQTLTLTLLGTCEASRFYSISNRTSDSGFDSK